MKQSARDASGPQRPQYRPFKGLTMGRFIYRAVFLCLVLSTTLTTFAWAAPAGDRTVMARVPAYVHDQVRQRADEQGEARVIVVMGDPALPDAWARDPSARAPAIQELSRRVKRAAPSFRVGREYHMFPFLAGTASANALRELARSPDVEAVYPDRLYRATLSESGPLIGQPAAEGGGHDGSGIAIAILDTGVDYTHPDLGGSANPTAFPNAKVVGGRDIINSDDFPMDDFGHGTYVAGIAAGSGATHRGIAPDARLVAVKVLDANGLGFASQIIAGIQWCIDHRVSYNIKVINLSLSDGAEWRDPEECDADPEGVAVSQAVAAGITVVAAAGNEGYTRGIGLPACASDAISVGATWDSGSGVDTPADFSDRGELLDVYAPGIWITSARWSSDPEGSGLYTTGAGTSASAPHVAGAAAVLAEMGVTSPSAIAARLARTGVAILDPSTNVATPRIDLVRAVGDEPTAGPDLIAVAAYSTDSAAFIGSSLDLTLVVRNQGDTASAACQALIVLTENQLASPQDAVLATVDVSALAPAETQTIESISGLVPGVVPGGYLLAAFADSGYTVTEKNETNNGFAGSAFTVDALSSYVDSCDFVPSMLKGEVYTISVTMRNDGVSPWTSGDGYALVAVSPPGTDRWGVTQVPLPVSSVASKATVTFMFNVTAPTEPGLYPCHWRMARAGQAFGEIATGANKVRVFDDSAWGQDFPAVSGNYIAYQDYSGLYGQSIGVTDRSTGARVRLPDNITFPLQYDEANGWWEPVPPYEWFDVSYNYWPDIDGPWVTWVVDDREAPPTAPVYWYYQITAQNFKDLSVFPLRITWQDADALSPAIDGQYVVWEDYRNDPDGVWDPGYWLDDDADIYLTDITDITGPSDHFSPAYPICTAPGPQLAPRISYPYVVWEDWRDLITPQSDIYLYDLTVDSDVDGIPNWKESVRPSPDPAEIQLTDTLWPEEFPDIDGSTLVWMDLRRDSGLGEVVDIYLTDLDSPGEQLVAAEPPTFRYHPRASGTKVVWEDWRQGQPDIYWMDAATGVGGPIAATGTPETWPDISADRVVYSKLRWTVQHQDYLGNPYDWDVYNVWTQSMFKDGSVGAYTFTDTPSTFWAWQFIEAAVTNGVVKGYTDGTYQPASVVNRDQMAAYIARAMAGGDSFFDTYDPGATPIFPDVLVGYWAYRYIQYCADPERDVVKGYEDGTYQPTLSVNRGQMAAYIGRAMAPGGDSFFDTYDPGPTPSFLDVPTTFGQFKYVEYIADAGVTQGYPDGLYHPEVQVKRDQMAAYISKAFDYVN